MEASDQDCTLSGSNDASPPALHDSMLDELFPSLGDNVASSNPLALLLNSLGSGEAGDAQATNLYNPFNLSPPRLHEIHAIATANLISQTQEAIMQEYNISEFDVAGTTVTRAPFNADLDIERGCCAGDTPSNNKLKIVCSQSRECDYSSEPNQFSDISPQKNDHGSRLIDISNQRPNLYILATNDNDEHKNMTESFNSIDQAKVKTPVSEGINKVTCQQEMYTKHIDDNKNKNSKNVKSNLYLNGYCTTGDMKLSETKTIKDISGISPNNCVGVYLIQQPDQGQCVKQNSLEPLTNKTKKCTQPDQCNQLKENNNLYPIQANDETCCQSDKSSLKRTPSAARNDNQETSKEVQSAAEVTKKLLFVCHICLKQFCAEDQLYEHCSNHQKYVCPQPECVRSFTSRGHLQYHLKTHSGMRCHQCDECGKLFQTPQHLDTHKLSHSQQKPFCCTICAKGFTTEGNMKNHMRLHSGEKPYSCDVTNCNKRFAELSSLKKHKVTHSGDKPYKCIVCNKGFSQTSSRSYHMKKHAVINAS